MEKNIENQLTIEFLTLFVENLKPIFKYEIDKDFMNYNTGTIGWSNAFRKTCDELNKNNLKTFYNSLDWEEFDSFCVEVGEKVVKDGLV